MMYCPFCNEEGEIVQARVKKLNRLVYICKECDSLWETKKIESDNCFFFSEYMEENGLLGFWSELEDVTVNWKTGDA